MMNYDFMDIFDYEFILQFAMKYKKYIN